MKDWKSKIGKPDKNGCMPWTGPINAGYGVHWVGGVSYRAHRLAYEEANGPAPAGTVVHHKCSNRACCNPEHLEAVTPNENCKIKGPKRRGETPSRVCFPSLGPPATRVVNRASVSFDRLKHLIPTRLPQGCRLDPETERIIFNLLILKFDPLTISVAIGCSEPTVRKHLKRVNAVVSGKSEVELAVVPGGKNGI